MPWPDAIDAELPPSRDDEPAALRAAIVDELADHLACAMDRERRRTSDDGSARRAVLDRFGDPARVARRLWLDAMKEKIMQQRALTVTMAVVAFTLVVMTLLTYSAMRQNAQINAALLASMESMVSANESASMEWTEVGVRVASARPDASFDVDLYGRPFDGGAPSAATITETTDASGAVRFGPIRPGTYIMRVRDGEDRQHERRVIVYPGRVDDIEVPWPTFATATRDVAVDIGMPENVAAKTAYTRLEFVTRRMEDGAPDLSWELPGLTVLVDADGAVVELTTENAAAVEEYMPQNSPGRRVRVDPDRLDFTDSIALPPDLGYELVDIRIYLQGTDALAVLRSSVQSRQRTSRYSFTPIPPFVLDGGASLRVEIPAVLLDRID